MSVGELLAKDFDIGELKALNNLQLLLVLSYSTTS